MKQYLIAGNWKMNLNKDDSVALAKAIVSQLKPHANVGVAVCPPSLYLSAVAAGLAGSTVKLGGQNLYPKNDGAFTGEVSGKMLIDVGCHYVILGHSERRAIFHESDEFINQKVFAAFEHSLTPIVCVGETLDERESGKTESVVESQCVGSLAKLTAEQMAKTVIAYEPVWAIGTGKTATPAQAEEVHAFIRNWLTKQFGKETADQVIIQYGGSVKADNAEELMGQPNINGALVGGASLKADSFVAICHAAK
jgi:triosephosphate isomerase (TIM)